MQVFVPNLNFEAELCGRQQHPSAATQQIVADLAPVMGILAESGDTVVVDRVPTADELPETLRHVRYVPDLKNVVAPYRLVPFGWTDRLRRNAIDAGMEPHDVPSQDAVWQTNARPFNAAWDTVFSHSSVNLPFGRTFGTVCHSISEWQDAVRVLAKCGYEHWVAKPPVSHAGRNRLLAASENINAQQRGWLGKHLRHKDGIYIEPWVRRSEEWSCQFDVSPQCVTLVGTTRLINDSAGRYLGSVIQSSVTPPVAVAAAVEHGRRVCSAASISGYAGPVGIDGFTFTDADGRQAWRLCSDINARYSMGRIALQAAMKFSADNVAFWGQFRSDRFLQFMSAHRISSCRAVTDDVRIVMTSPQTVGGQLTGTVTALLAGHSEKALLQVRTAIAGRQ